MQTRERCTSSASPACSRRRRAREIQHRALGAVVAGIDHRHTQFEGMMRLVVFHIARQEEIRTRSRGVIYQVAS